MEVKCKICGKIEDVLPSRAKNYKTCSRKCQSEYLKSKKLYKCYICNNEFHVKPFRTKNVKKLTCSIECSNKMKEEIYKGRNNPNTRYKTLDDNFFKEVLTEEKAYLLGWIASDGSILKGSISIAINKLDIKCLETIKNIICQDIPIRDKKTNMKIFTINSIEIVKDVCNLLNISYGKKSDKICFPDLKSDYLKWAFLRGFFDGDGSIIKNNSPYCKITTNSELFRKSVINFCKIPCKEYGADLYWSGNNALDFLHKIYENANYKLDRKYYLYEHIATWVPSIVWSKYYKNDHCSWSKTRIDAVSPSKERASDSGYDLVLLEKIKTLGKVEFYDTGIKIKPIFGYYFDLVPRSSITKSGYILANSVGIIDRTYLGNIIVALIKIDDNAPDLILPNRLVQIIPRQIVHLDFIEVESIDVLGTDRGEGGFGSTGV